MSAIIRKALPTSVQDYDELRAYAGPLKVLYVTDVLGTAEATGKAGTFILKAEGAPGSADDDGTVIVGVNGRLWKREFSGAVCVEWFGAVGGAIVDDWAAIQAATDVAAKKNGVVKLRAENYLITQPIVVTGSFRSVHFQGAQTGNHQTASSAGSCIVYSAAGASAAIRAEFLTFANENISIDGISFYNPALDKANGGYAIRLVRGAANGRYISGFRFSNIGVMGFGAALGFQGMNTVGADYNFIGNVMLENFGAQGCGIGMHLQNCSLNLVTLSNTLFFDCPYGGIRCEEDGDVGAGNGKGSVFIGTLCNKTHMEGVGGMFRTCPTPVIDAEGKVIRSSITLVDFTHEGCGGTVGPVAGEPFQLGVNTDIHVVGFVVDGISYGEVSLPYLNSSARLWCDSSMRVICNGGRIMTPKGVNAPTYRRTIPNGGFNEITVGTAEAGGFGIKSTLLIDGGKRGFMQNLHSGDIAGAPVRSEMGGWLLGGGVTVTWNNAAGQGAIQLRIDNAAGVAVDVELQVENLSSASITAASEI